MAGISYRPPEFKVYLARGGMKDAMQCNAMRVD